MTATVLVLDDDAAVRTVVSEALRREGYVVQAVGTLAECSRALASQRPDVLVSDVVLPDGDGLDHLASLGPDAPPTIVLSARNTLTTAVRATEAGAFEYLPKPFDLTDLTGAVRAALQDRGEPAAPIDEADRALPLIGRSPGMQAVYRVIARVVGTDLTVLISGESGTGKELVARALHDLGPRAAAPFLAINMAALPRDLIEAELFGHERGAFTGATQRNAGRFEQAAGGTLFLDEIGDMPLDAQTRLLRVLQSGEFTSVGGARPSRVDVRVVAATHRDPAAMIAAGTFREDLFYRLNVVPIALPPLRERRDDVPLLARHFLERAAADGLPARHLTPAAESVLVAHDWPGNVRELENAMRRLAALARDATVGAEAIMEVIAHPGTNADRTASVERAVLDRLAALESEDPAIFEGGTLYERIIGEATAPLITAVMTRCGGNQVRAARALGINRNTLRKRLNALAVGRSDQ
jgi:two-component system, NtrC family, nitrogen regulation response regulator GlnG